jgi:hypothetical protein
MTTEILDPLDFRDILWPDVRFYKQQREIIYSVRDNKETFVPAGNMLGKDFVAAFIIWWYFLCHHPVKILTSSATEKHLINLWGEMDRFLRQSKIWNNGKPEWILNHVKYGLRLSQGAIWKVVNGVEEKDSYLVRAVASSEKQGSGLAGHHAPYNLFVCDEASGTFHKSYEMAQEWAKRILIIGNTWPTGLNHFWQVGVNGVDVPIKGNGKFYRKVIKITAKDSPNVKAKKEILPGILPYEEYQARQELFTPYHQDVSLWANFPKDRAYSMFPSEWIRLAEERAERLPKKRPAKAMGCDPAEGGDNTVWTPVDEKGVIDQRAKKTPDTSVVTGETIALMREFNCPADKVAFDRGGGGQQHVDRLRLEGYKGITSVAFGQSLKLGIKRGHHRVDKRREHEEQQYVFYDRRSEMYWRLRLWLDPDGEYLFAIPKEVLDRRRIDGKASLRQQMEAIPIDWDKEGRLKLRSKNKRTENDDKCLTELIGCSPDELDSLVLALHALVTKARPTEMRLVL